MTTLPQTTTPLRLPRLPEGSGTQLSIPTAMPVGVVPNITGPAMSGGDVWRVIRSNWWLIVLGVVASAVVGYFVNRYLANHYSRYTASGLVLIHPDQDEIGGTEPNPQSVEMEQLTQARLLTHETLLLEVLRDPNNDVYQTEWFHQFTPFPNIEAAKEDLRDHWVVAPVTNAKLVQVSMTFRNPKDCKSIVQSIVDQHIRNQKAEKSAIWAERGQGLTRQKEIYEVQMKRLSDQLAEWARGLGMNGVERGITSVSQFELQGLVAQRANFLSEQVDAQLGLEAFNKQRQAEGDPDGWEKYLPSASGAASNDFQRIIDTLDIEIAANTQLGPESQKLKDLLARKKIYQGKLETQRGEQKDTAIMAMGTALALDIQKATQKVNHLDSQIKELKKVIAESSKRETEYAQADAELRDVREKYQKNQEQLDRITNLRGSWANVSWATIPSTPETPSFPRLYITLSLAVAIGLILSLGIAFLRELTDTSVRSPRDIARVGQMQLLGTVPHEADDPQSAGARLPLVIFDAPHSMAAEEYRKIRTRLHHSASLDTTRSILVTSSNPGDGKSTVASNLAAGLALNGRRILLVDANFRRPQLHQIFGVANEQGFSDVLNSLDYFDECIRETQVPNLTVLPSGVKPANPTELLESQLLIDFIERALEEFDHVIFDSGPLLIVSETMALAPRVDGVITVVRARANSRGVLQRTRDALRQVKAEHLGIILNAVRSQGGGYYGSNIKTYYAYQNA